MSVSASVRMALSKANKRQLSLGELWNTSPQVISNKLRLERWTGEELVQVAAFTGGKLAFVYPDGQEILISAEEKTKKKEKAKEKKPVKKKQYCLGLPVPDISTWLLMKSSTMGK